MASQVLKHQPQQPSHRHYSSHVKSTLILSVLALVVGCLVALIDVVFGKVLFAVNDIRIAHPWYFIPFLSIAGLLVASIYNLCGGECYRGMALIFEAGHGEKERIPLRLMPAAIVTTWITQLFGGSTGREGVGVQIGAIVGHRIGRFIKMEDASKILLLTGIAAGFAGLFQTPIAAFFFALEVLTAGRLEYEALIPIFIGSFSASYVSRTLGLPAFVHMFGMHLNISWPLAFKLVVLGIIFGITGGVFAYALHGLRDYLRAKFPNKPFLKIFLGGLILTVLLLAFGGGRYAGLSESLITQAFSGTSYWYDFALKMLLTIITLAVGFRGGEVMPLFVIGATLGAALAPLTGITPGIVVALGFVAVFGAGTNTMLAPLFVGAELFGYQLLPLFFVVCVVGYFFNGNKSIYIAQKQEMV